MPRSSKASARTWIALLRGINVGGNNKVPMADLRALLSAEGHADVRTYIQSGNVVFRSVGKEEEIAADLQRAIAKRFKLTIPVVVRSGDELARIVCDNPFPEADPARHLVLFCAQKPKAAPETERSPKDKSLLRGREIYIHFADGISKSKFTMDYLDRRAGTITTGRNWRTVAMLAQWAQESGATDTTR